MGPEFDDLFQTAYAKIYALSQPRGGYFSDAEGAQSGLHPRLRDEALARGLLVRVGDGVLRLALFPPVPHERVLVAWLALGGLGVVACRSALALHGLCEPGDELHLNFPPDLAEPDIVVPAGVVLHLVAVPHAERTWPKGIKSTTVGRALDDAAREGVDPALLAQARAKAVQRKLIPAGPETPPPPAITDVAFRLALLNALDGRVTARAEDPAVFADRVLATALPPEQSPLHELRWSEAEPLWSSIPVGADGRIRDISGVERYSALRVLDLRESLLVDLAPVASLPDLEAAHLGIGLDTNLAPLERCERLRRVRLDGFDASAHGAARARLEARGVQVDPIAGDARATADPFADPMLKLAVLDALSAAGEVTLPPLIAIDEYELDRENLDRLLAVPLPDAQLAAVVELCWAGGGMEIQHLVWPQFDGESGEFAMRSLRGIERLPSLRALRLDAGAYEASVDETDLVQQLRDRGVDVVIT